MCSIKLQINSREALERLIGGDSEVEVDIRNSIVQEFVRRHLKGLVNDDSVKRRINGIEMALTEEFMKKVEEQFGKRIGNSWDSKWELKKEVADEMNKRAREAINDGIRKACDQTKDEIGQRTINNIVFKSVVEEAKKMAKDELRKRFLEFDGQCVAIGKAGARVLDL